MRSDPRPELRVALGAAVAVLIAIAVTHFFHLPRWYWAVLVAVLLVNGTWGENVRKAAQRLGMTAFGCGVAWVLDWLTRPVPSLQITLMLIGILLAVYFRNASYPWMTFFVSIYVIFLFGIIGLSPGSIMRVRIYETVVGCGVAAVAGLIVPVPRSGRRWREQLRAFWDACACAVETSYSRLLDRGASPPATAPCNAPRPRDLIRRLDDLVTQHQAAFYEGMFLGTSRDRNRALMDLTRLLNHTVLALEGAAEAASPPAVALLQDGLASMRDCTLSHFRTAIARLPMTTRVAAAPPPHDPCVDQLRHTYQAMAARAIELAGRGELTREGLLSISPVITYTQQINQLLQEIERAERA